MSPRFFLRLEGLFVLLAAAGLYATLEFSWWLFAGLLLAPDLFMAGYLSGPRVGALLYNIGHTYVVSIGLGALGYALAAPLGVALALIWTAHIGMDRALGYGLKRQTSFHDTHLNRDEENRDGAEPSLSTPREPTTARPSTAKA